MVTYKATLVDVQYVQGGRCYWGIGPEWAPYNPQHGGVVGNYSLTWTNGSLNYYAPDNSAQKIGTKLFVAFTGGGGPAPCGPPDPHEGGRFPSLTVTVSAGITYPTTTTTTPTARTITGTIDYYYASGDGFAHGAPASTQVTPSRETMVEILASSSSSCSNIVLSSIYTDDFGDYSSTVSSTNKYVCVKIIAATSYSEIIPYPSTVDASGGAHVFYDAYATKALGPTKLKTSGDTTYSWKPTGVSAPIDQALNIDNAIIPGGEWLSAYGTTPKFLNILYPYPASKAISNFNADKDIGEINEDDAFDWGVLLHEYGHFVASLIGIDNSTPVSSNKHELGWNMTDHEGNKAQGLAIAWDEGFADFFSQMVQQVMGTSSLGLTDVGGTPPTYVDYTPTGTISFRLDVSGNTSPDRSLGEDNELSVARVLWSAFSLPMYSGESGSVAFVTTLARAMTSNNSRTLSGAVSALLAAAKATPWVPSAGVSTENAEVPAGFNEETSATTGGTILSSQNVAPTFTVSGISASGTSITLSWTAGQPSTAQDRLDFYLVQFFNSSWTTLLSEKIVLFPTDELRSGSEVFQTSETIPSDWKKGIINAVVLGWNTSATADLIFEQLPSLKTGTDPLTGPYISAPVSLDIR
jgi:hypothetical protein